MKYYKCKGEGYGSCKRCSDKGKWNRPWMCFLYKIENHPGIFCSNCIEEIASELGEKFEYCGEYNGRDL